MTNPRFLPRLAAGLFTLTATGALPVLTSLCLFTPSAAAQAPSGEITFDSFYQNLADYGDWYNTPDFGYVFQPYIAYKNTGWRPYTDGYWAETDQGWTWVSYEDFGWACYHYGRWTELENVGWVWVPGYEWGPSWVSWRTSDEYVGWAPLPPKATRRVAATTVERTGGSAVIEEEVPAPRPGGDRVYEGRVLRPEDVEEDYDTGYNAGVDVQYDIGPSHYNFVPVQSFGAPYLAGSVLPVTQNVIIIENTSNVTNIVYRRGPRDGRVIYCGGPDYSLVSRRVERPIPRLLLERRSDNAADRSGPRPDRFSVVRDNRLEIFAPLVSRQPVNVQVRPGRVRENLDRPRIDHGWRGAQQQDPRLVERLRERFQQQARQAPPARQAAENFVTPAAFRAQPPPSIQEQQRQHQPPAPRPAEGNNRPGGNLPPGAETQVPVPSTNGGGGGFRPGGRPGGPGGAPANPNPAVVQPVPGPGGRDLTDAERQARRDARQRELEQRQGNRPAAPAPGNLPPPPNVVSPGNPAVTPRTAPGTAPGQPARPNRTADEREAYRAAKQAERAREQAAGQPAQTPPPAPAAPGTSERTREEQRRGPRTREPQAAPPSTQPPAEAPARQPQADAAREQRRAARQQEEQQSSQRAAQQQQQAAERARAERQQQAGAERARAGQEQQQHEQRRAERQQQAAQQAQQARAREAQPQAAPQPREAPGPRQAPEGRRAPEARPQPQAAPPQPGQSPNEEHRKKRGDGQPQ